MRYPYIIIGPTGNADAKLLEGGREGERERGDPFSNYAPSLVAAVIVTVVARVLAAAIVTVVCMHINQSVFSLKVHTFTSFFFIF